MTFKKKIAVGGATLALSAGAVAGSASAHVDQEGLVNVAVTDTTVQVPIAAAANICGVAVNVLASALNAGEVDCSAEADSQAQSAERSPGGSTRQNGLVNVLLDDTTIQVPIAIAANVCGVGVGILSNAANIGDVDCDSQVQSLALVP